jgi:two-component system chemotaxis response regulator CheY
MRKIMVVEDSPAMRGLIASVLSQIQGVTIVEAENGYEALRRLPREAVDMIVMDINMPDINGLELLAFVRKNPSYTETPVVIVTTEGRDQDRQRALQLGANEYVTKPFEPADLVRIVGKYLP